MANFFNPIPNIFDNSPSLSLSWLTGINEQRKHIEAEQQAKDKFAKLDAERKAIGDPAGLMSTQSNDLEYNPDEQHVASKYEQRWNYSPNEYLEPVSKRDMGQFKESEQYLLVSPKGILHGMDVANEQDGHLGKLPMNKPSTNKSVKELTNLAPTASRTANAKTTQSTPKGINNIPKADSNASTTKTNTVNTQPKQAESKPINTNSKSVATSTNSSNKPQSRTPSWVKEDARINAKYAKVHEAINSNPTIGLKYLNGDISADDIAKGRY